MAKFNPESIPKIISEAIVASNPPRGENGAPIADWPEIVATLLYSALAAMMVTGIPIDKIRSLVETAIADLAIGAAAEVFTKDAIDIAITSIKSKTESAEAQPVAAPAVIN